jgi:hypothetical protein
MIIVKELIGISIAINISGILREVEGCRVEVTLIIQIVLNAAIVIFVVALKFTLFNINGCIGGCRIQNISINSIILHEVFLE